MGIMDVEKMQERKDLGNERHGYRESYAVIVLYDIIFCASCCMTWDMTDVHAAQDIQST